MILPIKQHETFHQSLLMLFSFLLPLHPRLAILCIILCGINWLMSGAFLRNFKSLLKPIPLLFIGFYFLHLVGMLYTANLGEGIRRLETKLPLLIFPLILFSFPIKYSLPRFLKFQKKIRKDDSKTDEKSISYILISYVLGCLTASLYSTWFAVIKSFTLEENWMFYRKLGSFLGFHPTYFSMYLSFAFFIVLFFLVKDYKTFSQKNKFSLILLSGWFFLFILLLSSRMTIFATALILGTSFLIWMYLNKKLWKGIVISFCGIILFGVSLKTLPGLKIRTNATIQRIEKQTKKKGVSDPRVNLWSAALAMINQNPIIGTGTGDAQDELVKIYKKNNYERELQDNYNPHNQYLQTTVTLGIIGGILLSAYLCLPFWIGFSQRDYLYLLFLALVILSFLTESILQTQRGTLFFGFFHSLFSMRILITKDKVNKKRAALSKSATLEYF